MRIQEDADGTTSPRIFISYRRDDTAGHAGHLYSDLVAVFGIDSVFMDTETIEPGADFTERLRHEIESGDVVIALIGKRWLGKRLRDPGDFVRLEIQSALDRKLRVIPVLVQGARMPSIAQLPESIAELSHRNALEISDTRWNHDVERLVAALQGKRPDMEVPSVRETAPEEIAASAPLQPSARESLAAAIAEARAAGDRTGLARLLERGRFGLANDRLDEARDDCIEALEIFVQSDNAEGASRALFNLAIVVESSGDGDLARRLLAEAMGRWADPGDPDLQARLC